MVVSLAGTTLVRMFDGSVKQVKEVKAGDQLMGDDGSARQVTSVAGSNSTIYTISYKPYIDAPYCKSFQCAESAVIPMVPDGNRANNMQIKCDSQKQYAVSYLEPIIDRDNKILRVEQRTKQFSQSDEALVFVDKSLPNFLYEPTIAEFAKYPAAVQSYFCLVRPLLPVRFTTAAPLIQNDAKKQFDDAKAMQLRSMDLPWIAGLWLSAGGECSGGVRFLLKELHKDVLKEVRRIFEAMKYKNEYDDMSGFFDAKGGSLFQDFMTHFGLCQNGKFDKNTLRRNLALESFSRIRGPFLAGVMDGCSDYGLGDANYGLECYLRGLPKGQTRDEIADLARSCSLTVMEGTDGVLTLAGGMLFRIPCVNNPPKDIPGLVSLSSYPNEEGQNVLLGMPEYFKVEKGSAGQCFNLEINGRVLLEDYTVVYV